MYTIAVVSAALAFIMIAHSVWVVVYAYSPLNTVHERLKAYASRSR